MRKGVAVVELTCVWLVGGAEKRENGRGGARGLCGTLLRVGTEEDGFERGGHGMSLYTSAGTRRQVRAFRWSWVEE
jgi:hypothetical protein